MLFPAAGQTAIVAGVAFALLMLVLQGLLRHAPVLRRELDEVV